MGRTARRIRQLITNQAIPADTHISTHNPPKMCGGYKKGASLPFVDKTRITNANKNNYMPAGLRGRAKVRR